MVPMGLSYGLWHSFMGEVNAVIGADVGFRPVPLRVNVRLQGRAWFRVAGLSQCDQRRTVTSQAGVNGFQVGLS